MAKNIDYAKKIKGIKEEIQKLTIQFYGGREDEDYTDINNVILRFLLSSISNDLLMNIIKYCKTENDLYDIILTLSKVSKAEQLTLNSYDPMNFPFFQLTVYKKVTSNQNLFQAAAEHENVTFIKLIYQDLRHARNVDFIRTLASSKLPLTKNIMNTIRKESICSYFTSLYLQKSNKKLEEIYYNKTSFTDKVKKAFTIQY